MKNLLKLVYTLLLASCFVFGQTSGPSLDAGFFNAASYGQWVLHTTTNTVAGSGVIFIDTPYITLSTTESRIYSPFAGTLFPLLVDQGPNQEIVTPVSVSGCGTTAPYGTCQVFGVFTKPHGAGARIVSGTYGLQDAIYDAQSKGGGEVVVDQFFQGAAGPTPITTAVGFTTVGITDNRTGTQTYGWNGSNYVVNGTNSGNVVGTGASNAVTRWTDSTHVGTGCITDDGSDPTVDPCGTSLGNAGLLLTWPNSPVGTLSQLMACEDSQARVFTCAPGATSGVLGPVSPAFLGFGPGVAGTAQVCVSGKCSVLFDNQSTVGDWAIMSSVVGGELHDTGSAIQTPGAINFLVDSTNTGAATPATINLSSNPAASVAAVGIAGTISANQCAFGSGTNTLQGSNNCVLDTSGGLQAVTIASSGTNPMVAAPVANAAGGTTALLLAKTVNGQAVTATTGDTAIPVFPVSTTVTINGVTVCAPGASGNACLAQNGSIVPVTFDAAGGTVDHFVVASTTVAGTGHDAGATLPAGPVCVIGKLMSSPAGNGAGTVLMNEECYPAATGSGTVFNNTTNTGTAAFTLDASASTAANAFKVQAQAGITPTADGAIATDTTSHRTLVGSNGATKTLVAVDSTDTLTNKTVVSTGAGGTNTLTGTWEIDIPFAFCSGTTPTLSMDSPPSGAAMTAGGCTGTNVNQAFAVAANAGTPALQYSFRLPQTLTGNADIYLTYTSAATSAAFTPVVDLICNATNGTVTNDPSFSAGNFFAPGAQTTPGTTLWVQTITATGVSWPASCAAGTMAHLRPKRTDSAGAASVNFYTIHIVGRKTL